MIKPKLFYNNRLRDTQESDDGTAYATCSEAVADPDDAFKVRGDIQLSTDISTLAALEGSGIEFDTTTNRYRIVDSAAALRRISSLGLLPQMAYARAVVIDGSYLYVACQTDPLVIVKIDLTTFTVDDSMLLATGENTPRALAVYNNFLYVCCSTSPSKVVKINLATFIRIGTVTLDSGENAGSSLAVYGSDLYVGCDTSAAIIVKVSLNTFTRTAALTLSGGEDGAISLAVYGSDLYVGCDTAAAIIVKINLGTFTRTSALTLNAGENNATSLAVYSTDLYVGCNTTAAIIVKVALGTFTRTAALTLNAGENLATALAVSGSFLYVGCNTTAARIVKVNLGTFTRTGAVTLNAGENYALGLAVSGSDLYVGCNVSPAIAVKLDLGTFTRTTALSLSDGERLGRAVAVYGSYLFVSCNLTPSVIVKVDLNTFTRVDALTLNAGENTVLALAVSGSYLYACCYLSPSIIVKIDLNTFTRIGALTLNAGENNGRALAVYGADLYVACELSPTTIVKVNLGTFTRTGALNLSAGENQAYALAVYGSDLYIACYGAAPSIIVKVDLTAFTRTGALTLNAGENSSTALAVYGSDLYVGCFLSPSRIVKVNLGTFTRTGAITLDSGENSAVALVVYGSYLYVGCQLSPSRIVSVDLSTFTRTNALTLNTGENLVTAFAVYNSYIYVADYTGPAAMIQKLDPLAYFQLFERLQAQDIGDSFTVRAGLTCATADSTRPAIYAADGHISPRFKGTENTELKLYAHASNLLADGGLESGAYSPNWTAGGANWTIESSSPLVGAYSAKCDFSTNDTLTQSIATKIKKTKTYRLIFMADSLTAAISAGALTITLRQAGSNTPIDANITGTQPVITTDAAWFEIEFTPDFTTNNWQIVLTPNMGLKGSSTGILLDEFYIYEKQTINSLWVDGHNWAGKGRIMIKPRRYSGLRSTAHPDAAFSRASVAYDSDGNSHASGVPRYETGADSTANGAILIEEGTTNLPTTNQASVETDLTGFISLNGGVITRVTTEHWHGSACIQTVTPDVAQDEGFRLSNIACSGNTDYTGSAWVKGSGTIKIKIYDGFVTTNSDVITLTDSWQHISITATTDASATYVSLRLSTSDTQQGITFYTDGIQLEQKSYATSWQLPSDGARANEALYAPAPLSATVGSIAMWVNVNAASKRQEAGVYPEIFKNGVNQLVLYHSANSAYWRFMIGNSTYCSAADSFTPDGWHWFVCTWSQSGNYIKLYIDGTLRDSSTYTSPSLSANTYIGSDSGTGHFLNAAGMDDFLVFNIVLTDTEIAALYAASDPRTLASYASCTWHQDFDSGIDSGGFLVDTSERFLKHIPSSDWPVVELTLPAVASWTAEAGEIYVGDYWQLPRYPQPTDPYATDEGGLREFSLNFSLIPAQYRTSQIEALFDRLRANEPVLVQWDTDDPILTEARTRARKASYDPYRIDLPLEFIERL